MALNETRLHESGSGNLQDKVCVFGEVSKPVRDKNHCLPSPHTAKPFEELIFTGGIDGRRRLVDYDKLCPARHDPHEGPGTE